MDKSYTEAIQYLNDNFERANEKGITYNNRYEAYLVTKGILPTERELNRSEDFAYDWFMALYYNQPQLLADPAITSEFVTSVLDAAMRHAKGDEAMSYMIAHEVAKRSVGK